MRPLIATALLCAQTALLCVLLSMPALTQHNHHQHHDSYRNWVNQKGEGCCNEQDCGSLNEADERERNGVLEVRIEGEWCKIEPGHYLKSGNVPNASTAHVCAWLKDARPGMSPCERLLCYQPRPLS